MKIKNDIEQNSNKWLEIRRKSIGSSDAPIIMDVSPYKTTVEDLIDDKLGKSQPKKSNYIQELGHYFEKKARAIYEFDNDIDMEPMFAIHSDFDFLSSSFDGINIEKKTQVEIKMVGKDNFERVMETNKPLEHHYPQLQHQLMVSGFSSTDYFIYQLNKNRSDILRTHCIKVLVNKAYVLHHLFPKELKFWEKVKEERDK